MACLLCLSGQAQSQKKNVRPKVKRPKVGVVLGGGGAKGAAHIGVLKYLEEMGIPVDYVAGTSIGSIIGGLYAMGYSPDELAQLIAEMDWSEYVGNKLERHVMSPELRQRRSTMFLNVPFSLEAVLDGNNHSKSRFMPSAYVNNTALINLFNNLCVGYQKEMDFNDLPIPFACVATDIRTGQEIDIRHGSVPTAMRASMAIPGVFAPVHMDGHILVDGGLNNNFPADLVKSMGADIIIGVDLGKQDTIAIDDNLSLFSVLNGIVDNAVSQKRTENHKLCDLVLLPDISGYGTLSFNRDAIDTLVNRGYRVAQENSEALTKIKLRLESKGHGVSQKILHAQKARNLGDEPVFVTDIVINQDGTELPSQWLLDKGGLEAKKYLSESDINNAVNMLRGTGAFDEITYKLNENKNDTTTSYMLSMNLKPSLPHVFGVGARYDTEEGAALLINVNLNEKRLTGLKLGFTGRLSYNPRINITGTYSKFKVANFNLAYEYRNQHYKTLNNSNNTYRSFNYVMNRVSAYASGFQLLNMNTAIGVSYTATSFDQGGLFEFTNDSVNPAVVGSPNFQDNRLVSLFLRFNYDNLDNTYFARQGVSTSISGHLFLDTQANGTSSQEVSLSTQFYFTPKGGSLTLIPQFYARFLFGSPTYANLWNMVGGETAGRHFDAQMPFIGLSHTANVGDMAAIGRLDLRYNIYGKNYFTFMYNYMGMSGYKGYHGIGLKYSYNSIIGPISLTGHWTDLTHQLGAYLSIGFTF